MWALLALACAKGRPRCPGWKAAHKAMCSLSKDPALFSFVDKKLLSPSCSEGQARWQRGVCDGLKHDHKFLVLPLRWRLGVPASSLIDSGWAVAALLPGGVWKKRHSCDCGVWVMKRHLIKSGTLMLGGLSCRVRSPTSLRSPCRRGHMLKLRLGHLRRAQLSRHPQQGAGHGCGPSGPTYPRAKCACVISVSPSRRKECPSRVLPILLKRGIV